VWFQRLDVQDLRNLRAVRLDLAPGLNYFHGANGAGKTALLEAVHLLARGRSFRSHQAAELIRQGADRLVVRAVVQDEHRGVQNLSVSRARRARAELRINGDPGRKLSEAAGLLPLQVMVPSLSDLVFGAPAERRQWLDWGTFHVKPDYMPLWRRYLHALRQRNAALKAVASGALSEQGLAVWTEELAVLGETVTAVRGAYLESLAPVLQEVLGELSPGMDCAMRYRRGWPEDAPLRKVLGESLSKEVKSGATQSGPHRAEVELRVAGLDAGATLSRGQGKALASALMLAQSKLLMRTARRAAAFLIDDIGAELDLPHSERFFRQLADLGVQVLATSSSGPEAMAGLAPAQLTVFHVEHGEVRRL
jgi:DNA replication and repair protein RecF